MLFMLLAVTCIDKYHCLYMNDDNYYNHIYSICTAFAWFKYCRYDVKPYPINQSINQFAYRKRKQMK